MNKYEILSHLVTVIAVIAVLVMAYLVHLLVTVHLSANALHQWLDRETDTYADYMEDEQERRTAIYHGDPDASSLRRWYGLSYLVERRLFVWQYNATAAINRRQLGFAKNDTGSAAGGLIGIVLLVLLVMGLVEMLTLTDEDVQRETTCIENAEYINSVGGDADLTNC